MKDTTIEYNEPESVVFKNVDEINQAVKDYDIKKYKLAQACGVSRSTILAWEHDMTPERLITVNQGLIQLINQKKKALFKALN